MHFGPHPATNGSIVNVCNGRHKALHRLIESVAFPLRKDRHIAFVKIVEPETVKHDNDCSLEGTSLVLPFQDSPQTRGYGSDRPILEYCSAAR